jgi:ribosome-associated toxin RatA of RatAB toxin-antitoxin module
MRVLTRTALIAQPPEVVFGLVNDIASYPKFVPGCSSAEIVSSSEHEVVARIVVHRGPLSTQLTTRNVLKPFHELRLELVEGPLRSLEGVWTFTPVGANGCRIDLRLQFQFSNPLKAALLEPLLEATATSMVQAFVARAQHPVAR